MFALKSLKIILLLIILITPSITSKTVSAAPLTISITPASETIPSDGLSHPAFYVSVKESVRTPKLLPNRVEVTLTCSDESALQIPKTVVIEPASYYTLVNATSSVKDNKQITVTAAATNFQSSQASISIAPLAGSPYAFKLTILPDTLLPGSLNQAVLIVTVVDHYGNPTKAMTDLEVALSSSSLNIANVAVSQITINKGETSVETSISTTGAPGTSTISASVEDFKIGTATVTVRGPKPAKIYLWSPQNSLVSETLRPLFIGIVDSSNHPVTLVNPITVNLFCTRNDLVRVPSQVTIEAGKWSKFIDIETITYGTATLTAIAENFTSNSISVTCIRDTTNPITGLKLTPIAPFLPTDGQNHTAMMVQAVDSTGMPTSSGLLAGGTFFAAQDIYLYSNSIDKVKIAEGQEIINLRWGRSWMFVNATGLLPGSAIITMATQQLPTVSTTINSYIAVPDKLEILTPPIVAGEKTRGLLVATSGGIPSPLVEDKQVLITSSNTEIGTSLGTITMEKGSYYSNIEIDGKYPGSFSLTASTSDLSPNNIPLKVVSTKPNEFNINYMTPIAGYTFPIIVQLTASSSAPSVTNQPIAFTLSSSNATSIEVPPSFTVNSNSTNAIIFCNAHTTTGGKITISSPGFTTLTTQIKPIKNPLLMEIVSDETGKEGGVSTVKVVVSLSETPVEGLNVVWKGKGLENNNTVTDSTGTAVNQLQVSKGGNNITASISSGWGGTLEVSKMINGVPNLYNLIVTSSAGNTIDGSGPRQYGDMVHLTAPMNTPMPGFIGLMGGKYVFQQWIGAKSTTYNDIILPITMDDPNPTIEAIYVEDPTMAYVTGGLIIVIMIAVSAFVIWRRRAPNVSNTRTRRREFRI